MSELEKVFSAAVKFEASDVHVAPGEPYMLRRMGRLMKLKTPPLSKDHCQRVVWEVLKEPQRQQLAESHQLDFILDIPGSGRFRGSAMMHHRGISAAFRIIPFQVPVMESLGLPAIATKILDQHQGLILVTGATGQGKSTTLAAMVDHINTHRRLHVLTVEDPIEFVHPLKKGVVNQRQIGRDTLSYANALRAALREDPDVIMIGELRDLETISLAISAAETGHLVLGTLSTSNAPKTVDRIIDAYPPGEQNQIRAMLSETLKAVITQQLIPDKAGKSMALAVEVLIGTAPMAGLIRDGKTYQIGSMMQTGKAAGMVLMDESIKALYQEDRITEEEALSRMGNPSRLKENTAHMGGGPRTTTGKRV